MYNQVMVMAVYTFATTNPSIEKDYKECSSNEQHDEPSNNSNGNGTSQRTTTNR